MKIRLNILNFMSYDFYTERVNENLHTVKRNVTSTIITFIEREENRLHMSYSLIIEDLDVEYKLMIFK